MSTQETGGTNLIQLQVSQSGLPREVQKQLENVRNLTRTQKGKGIAGKHDPATNRPPVGPEVSPVAIGMLLAGLVWMGWFAHRNGYKMLSRIILFVLSLSVSMGGYKYMKASKTDLGSNEDNRVDDFGEDVYDEEQAYDEEQE